jgi:hypothetical protein
MNVNGITNADLAEMKFEIAPESDKDSHRAYLSQAGLVEYATRSYIVTNLRAARAKAATDAIKNLARYKFSMFGYHAARWVTLNAILGDRQPNPFKSFVDLAKKVGE